MAISLKSLSKARQADRMPMLAIHGLEKTGKTSLACQFPNTAFLRVESGPPDDYDLPGWDIIDWNGPIEDNRAGLMTAIDLLYNEEHDIDTLVLDSTSKCDTNIIHPDVCAAAGVSSIEDIDYGKGYIQAYDRWVTLLNRLDALRSDRAMTIILICHSKIREMKEPDVPSYDRFEIDLHESKKLSVPDLVKRSVDGIFFIRQDTQLKAEDPKDKHNRRVLATGSNHYIHTRTKPAWTAGNRWSMDEKILYPRGKGFEAVAKFIPSLRERYDLPMPVKAAPKEEVTEKQAA